MQDLASILEQIPHYWQEPGRKPAGGRTQEPQRIQTFIFSATLTLPAGLRKRLAKGKPFVVSCWRLNRHAPSVLKQNCHPQRSMHRRSDT